jgi:hypothetical protein
LFIVFLLYGLLKYTSSPAGFLPAGLKYQIKDIDRGLFSGQVKRATPDGGGLQCAETFVCQDAMLATQC